MDKLIIDLWPFLISALFAAVGWLWKKIISMSERLIVMETNMTTCKTNMDEDMQSLKEKIINERDQIHKMIDKIQQRQDSHSKKQDEILTLITDFKVEVIRQISELSTDMKALNSTIKVFDNAVAFSKKTKEKKG